MTRTTLRHRMQHTVQSKGANKWRSATRTSPSLWESSSSSSYQSSSYYNQYFTIITTTITIATIIVTMTPMISDTPSACVTRLCATPTRTTSVEAQGALSSSSSTWKTPSSLSKNQKIQKIPALLLCFLWYCSPSLDSASPGVEQSVFIFSHQLRLFEIHQNVLKGRRLLQADNKNPTKKILLENHPLLCL